MNKEAYARNAALLMGRRDVGVELYYCLDKSLVVYDPEKNEWAQGNDKGEIETYFRPRRGRDFVRRWIEEGRVLELRVV